MHHGKTARLGERCLRKTMANLMQSLSCQKELKKNVTGRHNVDTSYYPLTEEPHSVEIRTGVNVRWPGGNLQWNRNGWTQS